MELIVNSDVMDRFKALDQRRKTDFLSMNSEQQNDAIRETIRECLELQGIPTNTLDENFLTYSIMIYATIGKIEMYRHCGITELKVLLD